jgi:hypothetical protein
MAMWIRTQNLLDRFSDNKKQKAVLPGTAHWASAFGESDLTTGGGNTGVFTGEIEVFRIRVLRSRLVAGLQRQPLQESLKIHKG